MRSTETKTTLRISPKTMNSPLLLTRLESCDRAGFWSRNKERSKLDDTEMLQAAIRAGVMESRREDWGEVAGEKAYALGSDPGLETTHYDVHSEVVHLACIADVVTTAIRKPQEKPWLIPDAMHLSTAGLTWKPATFVDASGTHLRRVVLVSSWNDDRHYSEARSWFSIGEVCAAGLPMQQVVIVLGQRRNGKRHSPWSKGLRHPLNKKLRFRKKNDVGDGFKSTWKPVWREDFDDIATRDWLESMLQDGVLQDVCFRVDIAVPGKMERQRILDLAARKLEKLEKMAELPDQNLSTCDWPKPCVFRGPCHRGSEPSEKNGFIQIR